MSQKIRYGNGTVTDHGELLDNTPAVTVDPDYVPGEFDRNGFDVLPFGSFLDEKTVQELLNRNELAELEEYIVEICPEESLDNLFLPADENGNSFVQFRHSGTSIRAGRIAEKSYELELHTILKWRSEAMSQEIKQVSLAEFAIRHYGFRETEKSTKNSPCLKNPAGDVIVIKYQADGANTFFSPKDNNLKGDIYNFVMWQDRCDFRTAAAQIEKLLGVAQKQGNPLPVKTGEKKVFDREAVKALRVVTTEHPYLESRGIPPHILGHGRFAGCILTDSYHNAVFPHYRGIEMVGYTKKNTKFNGFSEGGEKLLWASNHFPGDTKLCVCEAAIDALSLATLMQHDTRRAEIFYHTRFVSIDGGMSPEAESMLRQKVMEMPQGSVVEAAFDNDKQGTAFTEKLRAICQDCGVKFVDNHPKVKKDWNDVLQAWNKYEEQKAYAPPERRQPKETYPGTAKPISPKQRTVIDTLAKDGWLNPVPPEVLDRMTAKKASVLIYTGLDRQRKGEKAPVYVAPPKTAPGVSSATAAPVAPAPVGTAPEAEKKTQPAPRMKM